ncbi:MAG: hypothetical protein U1A77_08040 [Pirellulales bacterium]
MIRAFRGKTRMGKSLRAWLANGASPLCVLALIVLWCFSCTGQESSTPTVKKATTKESGESGGKAKDGDSVSPRKADSPASEKPAAKAEPPRFLRVKRDEDQTVLALETSITRYVPRDAAREPLFVDLVAVVHIGEHDYYEALNKRFKDYDAVLYELVAPEGTRIPKGGGKGGGAHPVSAMQNGMKSMLGLEFQLERVDYTPRHFIHADMTPEEMSKSMSDRQESWSQMFLRMIGQGIAQQAKQQQQGGGGDFALLAALFAKDRTVRLKRILATQFEDMDASLAALDGPDGSTLITQRNKKALQVLDRELKAGKKRIAIFYGAGHMVDLEQRLLADFALRRTDESWLTAWSMTPAK